MGLPEGISEDMLKEMSENPGVTYSGVGGSVITPRTHFDISNRADKGVRPNIGGNESHDVRGGRINRPSPDLARRLSEGDKQIRKAAA